MKDFSEFERITGIEFRDKAILKQAFIHRSYLNENKEVGLSHNERLEFLGDAVLELVITDFLYEKYPDKAEGDLTAYRSALVNASTCASVAMNLSVNDFLLLSKGESKDTGRARQYILANTLEAIIGAIYLDQKYDAAREFILKNFSPLIDDIVKMGTWIDSKSRFQEKAQEEEGVTPQYKTIRESGPDHDKKFTVGVFLRDKLVAQGDGESKQEAEQKAAAEALQKMGWE
ncbi:MAG TPA: ribonuclease III [Candidatus Paceibacterota bacterium]|jgi:ribonuclease-3|nr:ribonuclease III [Candidatus Paceibacterota bacterium]